MLNKPLRITLGFICAFIGTVLFFLPGSILFLLAGLMLLSIDFPIVKGWLKTSMRGMSRGAAKLDRFFLNRRFR